MMLNIDKETIIKILPIAISAISIFYTRKIEKREEKRYRESIKNELRYEALLISKELESVFTRYSFEYDFIELRSKQFNDLHIDKSLLVRDEDMPTVLSIRSERIPNDEFNIYNYKMLISKFSKEEIEMLETIFALVKKIDGTLEYLKIEYEKLELIDDFIDVDSQTGKAYLKAFGMVRSGYHLLFETVFNQDAREYEYLFKKIDSLSKLTDDEVSKSLILNYNLLKDRYLNYKEHIENLEININQQLKKMDN